MPFCFIASRFAGICIDFFSRSSAAWQACPPTSTASQAETPVASMWGALPTLLPGSAPMAVPPTGGWRQTLHCTSPSVTASSSPSWKQFLASVPKHNPADAWSTFGSAITSRCSPRKDPWATTLRPAPLRHHAPSNTFSTRGLCMRSRKRRKIDVLWHTSLS